MWTIVDFGKWRDKNKTLPQILVSDPDWFFWAVEKAAFDKNKSLADQAKILDRRARSIKIPEKHAPNDTVQYWTTADGKFSHIELISATQSAHQGSSSEVRRPYLNLHAPRSVVNYDKLGYRRMMSNFRYYWFDDKNFTKSRIEAFFSTIENFNRP